MSGENPANGSAGSGALSINSKTAFDALLNTSRKALSAKVVIGFGLGLAVITFVFAILGYIFGGQRSTMGEDILMATLASLILALGIAMQSLVHGTLAKLMLETLSIEREAAAMEHATRLEETKQKRPEPPRVAPAPGPGKVRLQASVETE